MAFAQDILTRIININLGGDAIVVFVNVYVFDFESPEPLEAKYVIEVGADGKNKAEFLQRWVTPIAGVPHPGFASFAFKVPIDVGRFITFTAPALYHEVNGFWFDVLVFAIKDNDIGTSLNQAIEGTKKFSPELYKNDLGAAFSPLPGKLDPEGLRWGVQTGASGSGQVTNFKYRFGDHRVDDDKPNPLPNAMVQCYPLGPPFLGFIGDLNVTYNGYYLHLYRLDEDGTGAVYSMTTLDPAWRQPIVSGYTTEIYGIPFQDPPPLVTSDAP